MKPNYTLLSLNNISHDRTQGAKIIIVQFHHCKYILDTFFYIKFIQGVFVSQNHTSLKARRIEPED